MIIIITTTDDSGLIVVRGVYGVGQLTEQDKLAIATDLLPAQDKHSTTINFATIQCAPHDMTTGPGWAEHGIPAEHDADGAYVRLDTGKIVRSS